MEDPASLQVQPLRGASYLQEMWPTPKDHSFKALTPPFQEGSHPKWPFLVSPVFSPTIVIRRSPPLHPSPLGSVIPTEARHSTPATRHASVQQSSNKRTKGLGHRRLRNANECIRDGADARLLGENWNCGLPEIVLQGCPERGKAQFFVECLRAIYLFSSCNSPLQKEAESRR